MSRVIHSSYERRAAEENRAWSDAERKYLLQFVAKLPDPEEYASTLPILAAEVLAAAHWSNRDKCWWVDPDQAKILIPYGLCEVGNTKKGPALRRHDLGGFGIKVMRAIKKDWQ